MARRYALFLKIPLMIFFGAIERRSRSDLRDDGPAEPSVRALLGSTSHAFLLRGVKENRRTILRADVRALPIGSGWVVHFPESVEELFVADSRGVKGYLDGLCVSGAARAYVAISRIFHRSAYVTDRSIRDTFDFAERGFHTPETPCGERCLLHCLPPPTRACVAAV